MNNTIRRAAAVLMLATGIGHLALPLLRPMSPPVMVASLFGAAYLLIGALLWRGNRQDGRRGALWAGLILPAAGGALALIAAPPGANIWTPVGTAMLMIDLIVPLTCLWLLTRRAA